jgi:aspartate aminotransferase
MAARAKAMKAAGVDVVSMSLGEPDMDTPEHVRRAVQAAVDDHWSHYGPVAGIPALREAVANYQNSLSGNAIPWIADDVVVSVGAKMAIYNAIQTVINQGDEVVIPMPAWVSYSEMVKLAQGNVVAVHTKYEDNY